MIRTSVTNNFPSQVVSDAEKSSFEYGMKVAKASTSYGKKGVINDSKKAFKAVTKEASRIKKGGKLANKGIRRKIGQAIKKVLK